jgi:chaperonin GroES
MRDDGNRSAVAVSVGDEVLFGRYAGNDVEVNGKEFKIMRESDILAKVVK